MFLTVKFAKIFSMVSDIWREFKNSALCQIKHIIYLTGRQKYFVKVINVSRWIPHITSGSASEFSESSSFELIEIPYGFFGQLLSLRWRGRNSQRITNESHFMFYQDITPPSVALSGKVICRPRGMKVFLKTNRISSRWEKQREAKWSISSLKCVTKIIQCHAGCANA